MRTWIALPAVLACFSARAQGGPTVSPSTGELAYRFEFSIPEARGRFQPSLALEYQSDSTGDVGFGWGWGLSASYIELDSRASPAGPDAPRTLYFLRSGASRTLLVKVQGATVYRPEISSSYWKAEKLTDGSFEAVDGAGNRYAYVQKATGATRWYLTTVTDPDGNVTTYAWEPIGATGSAILSGITYNGAATEVALTYRDAALGIREEAGSLVDHGKQLQYVQILNKRASDAVKVAVRTYAMEYGTTPQVGHQLLRAVHEWGKTMGADPTMGLDGGATRFDYDTTAEGLPSVSIAFDPASQVNYATIFGDAAARPAWLDMDADGRPDLVWKTFWARNTTPAGAAALTFDAARVLVNFAPTNSVSFANPLARTLDADDQYANTTEMLLDFNGDGYLDFMRVYFEQPVRMTVQYGQYDKLPSAYAAAGDYEFGYAETLDTIRVWNELSGMSLGIEDFYSRTLDVTGDGIADYVREGWVFEGYANASGSGFGSGTWVNGVDWPDFDPATDDDRPTMCFPSYHLLTDGRYVEEIYFQHREAPFVDVNGDGIVDRVHVDHERTWAVSLSAWPFNDSFALWGTAMFGLTPHYYLYDGGSGPAADASAVLVDLNGDGLPEYLRVPYEFFPNNEPGFVASAPYAYPAEMQVRWNTGRSFADDGSTLYLSGPLHSVWRGKWQGDPCKSGAIPPIVPAHGVDAFLGDVNGDGIVDYVKADGFQLGHNGYEVGRSILLRKVTTRGGAAYDVTYAPATKFGFDYRTSPRPLAESLTTSGPGIAARAFQYKYSGPVFRSPWYDPAKTEFRGFEESWVVDGGTGLRTHFAYTPQSHAFQRQPSKVEVETYESSTWRVVTRESRHFSARNYVSNGCVSSTDPDRVAVGGGTAGPPRPGDDGPDPAADQYPVIVFQSSNESRRFFGAYSLRSSTSVACEDVDGGGNVLKTFTDPDTQQAGDGYYTVRTFELEKTCAACVRTEAVQAESGETLKTATSYYDAKDRLQHVGRAFSGAIKTYNDDGTLGSITDGETTTSYSYDEQGLRVVKEEVSSGAKTLVSKETKTLVTERAYDPDTGALVLVTGPYISGGTQVATKAGVVYDGLGRVIARTRASATATSIVDAVEAFAYFDFSPSAPAVPASVRTYRFATPKTYDKTAAIPDDNAVVVSIAYLDGLGQEIQTRKRLGKDDTTVDDANVVQGISGGYEVTAIVRDAAGRVTHAFDRYYSTTGDYKDLKALSEQAAQLPSMIDGDLGSVARVTVSSWDSRGRPLCSAYQPMDKVLPLAPTATTCNSKTDASAAWEYKLATRYEYGTMFLNGRLYASVRKTVPETNQTLGVTELFDSLGRSMGRIDDDGNRTLKLLDPLGRETALLRQDSTGLTHVASTTEYDLDGRTWKRIDPSFGVREYLYDAGGRLEHVKTEEQTGTLKREVVNAYGDMNRITTVTEYTYEGTTQQERVLAAYSYDETVTTGYVNLPGRVASIANGTSTLLLGYSPEGLVEQRDQNFAAAAGRFALTSTHRADGSLAGESFETVDTGSTVEEGIATTVSLDYDSAGRPVRRKGGRDTASETIWELPEGSSGYGAYDPTGRVPEVQADGGRVVTKRTYSRYSGNLTAETKTLGTSTSVYSADTFEYRGIQLRKFVDQLTGTTYLNSYDPGGRLARQDATAKDACNVGRHALAQDGSESLSYYLTGRTESDPSIGNVQWADTMRNECVAEAVSSTSTHDAYQYNSAKPDQLDVLTTTGDTAETALDEAFRYDEQDHLVSVTRSNGDNETLAYGPDGELAVRWQGATVTMYVGSYATVRAALPAGCSAPGPGCVVQPSTVKADVHVLLGKTRIASVSATRTLYYYRDRLGSIVATSLGGGTLGAMYRYSLYGRIDKSSRDGAVADPNDVESELGYSGALKLSGGLLYLKARVYDTKSRRFLTADLVDPRRYAYAGGDPVNFVDLLGLDPAPVSSRADGSVGTYDDETGEYGSVPASLDLSLVEPFSYAPAAYSSAFWGDNSIVDEGPGSGNVVFVEAERQVIKIPGSGPTGVLSLTTGVAAQYIYGLELNWGTAFDKRGNSGLVIGGGVRVGAAGGAELNIAQLMAYKNLPSAEMLGGPSLGGGAGWHPIAVSYAFDVQSFTPDKNFCGDLAVQDEVVDGHGFGVGPGIFFGGYVSGGYTLYIPLYRNHELTPFGIPLGTWRQSSPPLFALPVP